MPVNKYLEKKEYLDDFRRTGKIRIGNIKEYRITEDIRRKDKWEGVRLFETDGQVHVFDQKDLDGLLRDSNVSISVGAGRLVFGKGARGVIGTDLPNAFIFCASAGKMLAMQNKYGKNYFTIIDVEKFGKALLKEINKKFYVQAYSFDSIKYIESKNLKDIEEEYTHKNVNAFPRSGQVINLTIIQEFFGNYFTKEATNNFDDEEFRFAFLCEEEIGDEPLFVELEDIDSFVVFND